jgi:protein-S-isoprenylcysteine O-methyltransferase Ste14
MILRHILSILILPFVFVVVVPYWLLSAFASGGWNNHSFLVLLILLAGVAIALVGLALFTWCITLFARIGQGTLAPWDPTRKLVAAGPYQYVRNPMIFGVLLILIGQALFWSSIALALWAALFFSINHVYFIMSEEPGLEMRFGESYRLYKMNVPRWIPRLKPWISEAI